MRHRIYTETGSVHEIDDKRMTYARLRVGMGNELRRDGEEIPLKAFALGEKGDCCWFLLQVREDGQPTMRQTSTVTRVERFE